MKIGISRKCLGGNLDLLLDEDMCAWQDGVPEDHWVCGDKMSARDVGTIAQAMGQSLPLFDTESQSRMWKQLRKAGTSGVPWMRALPPQVFKKKIKSIRERAEKIVELANQGYYGYEFVENRELLLRMEPSSINTGVLKSLLGVERNSTNKTSLLRCVPSDGDKADVVRYSQISSSTGRLTVTSGPNILTLKKDHRKIFRSGFKNGQLLQVDIICLEPRVALSIAQREAPYDIYTHVQDEVLGGNLSRDETKIATIGCLYGMTASTLQGKIPSGMDAGRILSNIRDYFDVPNMERSLRQQAATTGHIQSFYNRLIKSDSAHVNHYLQCTGVDAALLGFGWLLEQRSLQELDVRPIFVIHDAIVLDVREDQISRLRDITDQGLHVKRMQQRFPVKVENFCHGV